MSAPAFSPPPHPVLPVLSPGQAAAMGEEAWARAMALRASTIAKERFDPLQFGYEPPIWKLCDCLIDAPWLDSEYARKVRAALGFDRVVKTLLLLGGNRASKSQYAARTTMRLLLHKAWRRAWCLHNKRAMGVTYQQPVVRRYMPPRLRRKIKEEIGNINFSIKNGFTEGKFVLPTGSECEFLSYEDDPDSFEGGELDVIWDDELVPPELVETFELRLATRDGVQLITFTPVRGYSATVRMFQDGAKIVMESVAYLAPKDGLAPDIPAALGLTAAELAELNAATSVRPERAAAAPQSRPEDVVARALAGELTPPGKVRAGEAGQRAIEIGDRRFELVPRVAKCAIDESNPQAQQRAIVWFHSSDNPYGNPKNVVGKVLGKSRAYVLERFHGKADKLVSTRFPLFTESVHTVDPKDIPATGTNVLVADPSTGRNFFMLWGRFTPECLYIYREWPGDYDIPGHGIPGPWALPDGKKPDGRPGPAQDSFGFGFLQYKTELARLEGWRDYERKRPADLSEEEWIRSWSAENGARERLLERLMDSRFASQPKLEVDRPVTLITDFEKWGVVFLPITGHGEGDNSAIREGVIEINALLRYDAEKPVDYFNAPKLKISNRCRNLIYSLQNWTGHDGTKGACKDPIDCLRYLVQGGYAHLPEGAFESVGGGHY